MTADIGELRRQFRPGLENIIAGFIIGVGMIIGACALVFMVVKEFIARGGRIPFFAEKEMSWVVVLLIGGVAIGLAVGGYFLIKWMRWLGSLDVQVGSLGLRVTEAEGTRVIAWQDITSVVETHLYERLPVKGPARLILPKVASQSFLLKTAGEGFGFDGNSIKGHTDLAALVKEETDKRNIPWEIEEVQG